jgi:raffinose/stachyose/melibiose transport system permease protein
VNTSFKTQDIYFTTNPFAPAAHPGTLWRLTFPLTRPAIVTVSIYSALLVWNNFLPPLALWSFQGQFSVNVPAVLASVALTTMPILTPYVRPLAGQEHDVW